MPYHTAVSCGVHFFFMDHDGPFASGPPGTEPLACLILADPNYVRFLLTHGCDCPPAAVLTADEIRRLTTFRIELMASGSLRQPQQRKVTDSDAEQQPGDQE